MRNLLFLSLLLFSFTGCQDKEQAQKEQASRDAQIAEQVRTELKKEFAEKEAKLQEKFTKERNKITQLARESLLLEQEAQRKILQQNTPTNNKLSDMGLTVDEGIISIDTNKTRDFFKALGDSMNKQIIKVGSDLQKGIINIKNAGIDINNEHINIDLNKTKTLLDTWSAKMQIFVKEFDTEVKKIDNNITTKGN